MGFSKDRGLHMFRKELLFYSFILLLPSFPSTATALEAYAVKGREIPPGGLTAAAIQTLGPLIRQETSASADPFCDLEEAKKLLENKKKLSLLRDFLNRNSLLLSTGFVADREALDGFSAFNLFKDPANGANKSDIFEGPQFYKDMILAIRKIGANPRITLVAPPGKNSVAQNRELFSDLIKSIHDRDPSKQPVVAIGHSYGGVALFEICMREPGMCQPGPKGETALLSQVATISSPLTEGSEQLFFGAGLSYKDCGPGNSTYRDRQLTSRANLFRRIWKDKIPTSVKLQIALQKAANEYLGTFRDSLVENLPCKASDRLRSTLKSFDKLPKSTQQEISRKLTFITAGFHPGQGSRSRENDPSMVLFSFYDCKLSNEEKAGSCTCTDGTVNCRSQAVENLPGSHRYHFSNVGHIELLKERLHEPAENTICREAAGIRILLEVMGHTNQENENRKAKSASVVPTSYGESDTQLNPTKGVD